MWMLILIAVAGLFVVGVIAAALGRRLISPAAIIVNLLLIALIFGLGHAGSVEPGDPSGNGNPALLLTIPLLILGFTLIFQIAWLTPFRRLRSRLLLVVLFGLLAHQAAGFEIQAMRYRQLRTRIAEALQDRTGELDAHQLESVASGGLLSIHLNSHFFHTNTYLLFVGWAAIAAVAALLIRKAVVERQSGRIS
ncbi:hypothetical protein QWJ34_15865 [Saccharibacillus sp. CPCC 101409]|uniref:hypothetical protein n=1 Tax=Saccharibacillus sp. CPCC 101409 TaxID=3058041 RepID=UPI0026710745|nr:hypothetical protein [Saccharibacillus sp. CPCC 101409]MDO3411242.1 hypothetical protein [Saccharibacillus sp. CPCC 101409]